jgi:hypothetical protein
VEAVQRRDRSRQVVHDGRLRDGVEEGEWFDAAFLRSLIPAAVPVTIGEGERKVQDLRVR